jgi:uncharacterized membrane protein
MAEKDEAGGVTDEVADAPEKAKDAVSDNGAGENGGDGLSKLLLIPAVAAGVAAVGYGAKKVGPKVMDSLSSGAADTAEDATEGVLEKTEQKGGVAGMGAKMLRNKAGDDGEGGGMMSKLASPFAGGGDDKPSEGWGKGRRNPIQLVADVAVPVEVAYDQWTQLEEFPKFMHRVTSVKQEDDDPSKVRWQEKIWFSTRDWEAEIIDQIPNERISWRTVSGTKHTGHVTFHELDDNLTRVIVNLDFYPSGILEKMASGLRFVKRAAKSDLYRYKAFIETHKEPTGTWRGRIEEGEIVEDAEPEEGKPFEEGSEQRRPQSSDGKGGDEEEKERSSSDEDDKSDEERQAARAEREKRRAEREQEREQAGARG